MNIQQPAEDSRVNCGSCQNLDLASSIMGCSYWLASSVYVCVFLVLVYAHACAACLRLLALVLTQGQRCLSMLSVLTDVRLQGGALGLEASIHWRHTPPQYRMSTHFHTHKNAQTYCLDGIHRTWAHLASHMLPSAYTNTLDPQPHAPVRPPLPSPPALFVTISPSSSALWVHLPTYSSFHPSIYRLW